MQKILILPCLLAICVYGCSTGQIVGNVADQVINTVDTFGKQKSVQESFLTTSTTLFYPNGVPANVSELPHLSDENVALIQGELDVQAKLLLDTLRKDRAFLSKVIGRKVLVSEGQKFIVQQRDRPTVHLDDAGTLVIDLRILQSIYRGVLLSATASKLNGCNPPRSNECQRQAMALVFAARDEFLNRSPVPITIQGKNIMEIIKTTPQNMEDLRAVMNQQLGDALYRLGTEKLAIEASKRFDDAMLFVIAHELGHKVLNHYNRMDGGEKQYDIELEADRFAGILSSLTRNRSVRPRHPVLKRVNGQIYQMTDNGWCNVDYNHKPTGHTDFFQFGYEFAGFLDGSTDYPSKAKRVVRVRSITTAAMSAIDRVQTQKGLCYGGMPKDSTDVYLEKQHKSWVRELNDWHSLLEKEIKENNRDYYKEHYQRGVDHFSDLTSETQVFDLFYREFLIRI